MVKDWQKELKVLFTDVLDGNGEDMTTTKIQAKLLKSSPFYGTQFSRYKESDLLHSPVVSMTIRQ
jgi:hypothetical protein